MALSKIKIALITFLCYLPKTIFTTTGTLTDTISNLPTKRILRCQFNPTTKKFWITGSERNKKIFSIDFSSTPLINGQFSPSQPGTISRIEPFGSNSLLLAGSFGINLRLASDPENEIGMPPTKLPTKKVSAIIHIRGTELVCANLSDLKTFYKFLFTTMTEIGNVNDADMPENLNNVYHHLNSNFVYLPGAKPYISCVDYTNLQFVKFGVVSAENIKWTTRGVRKDEIWYITDVSFFIANLLTQQQEESYLNLVIGKFRKLEPIFESDLVFLWEREAPVLYCYKFERGGGAASLIWNYSSEHYVDSQTYKSLAFCFFQEKNLIVLNRKITIEIISDSGSGLDCSSETNCQKCGYINNFCIECKTGFKIKAGKCVERCGEGFYYSKEENLCVASPCENSRIFDGYSFCQTCTINQYADEDSNSCIDCSSKYSSGCMTCDYSQCLSCSDNQILNFEKIKCESCPENFSKENETRCNCKNIKCCLADKEYFFEEKCEPISSVPEEWGLEKTDAGLKIKKCLKENCKNCKENFSICKDPIEKDGQTELPQETVNTIQNQLQRSEEYKKPIQEIISSAALFFGLDGGGSIASTTQNLRVIGLMRFLGVDFGAGLESNWSNEDPDLEKEIMFLGKKYGDKLAKYGVSFYPSKILLIKTIIYIFSWLNFLIGNFALFIYGPRVLTKLICWYFHLSKKLHFVIMNSCFVELLFLQIRVVLQFKINKETSWFNTIYYNFILLSFFLFCIDLLAILKVILRLSQPKITKRFPTGTKNLEVLDFGTQVSIKTNKREIDKSESYNLIKKTNFAIQLNILSDFRPKNHNKNFDKIKMHKLFHFLRIGILVTILVGLQQIPAASIFLLILMELSGFLFTLITQIKYKYMFWLPFTHKIITNLGMMIFLFTVSILTYDSKVSGAKQSTILIVFIFLSAIENLFMVIELIKDVFYFFWYRTKKIKRKFFVKEGEEVYKLKIEKSFNSMQFRMSEKKVSIKVSGNELEDSNTSKVHKKFGENVLDDFEPKSIARKIRKNLDSDKNFFSQGRRGSGLRRPKGKFLWANKRGKITPVYSRIRLSIFKNKIGQVSLNKKLKGMKVDKKEQNHENLSIGKKSFRVDDKKYKQNNTKFLRFKNIK